MTYQDLLFFLQTLDHQQLKREVAIYDPETDLLKDAISLRITAYEVPTVIDKDYPYLVIWAVLNSFRWTVDEIAADDLGHLDP